MIKIYENSLLPSIDIFFDDDNIDQILQEDNDPKHRSNLAKKWKKENNIKVLPQPSMSPDQNPIENIWKLIKIKITKKKIKILQGLKSEIQKEQNKLPSDLAEKLCQSMKNRIDTLIIAQGDYTIY